MSAATDRQRAYAEGYADGKAGTCDESRMSPIGTSFIARTPYHRGYHEGTKVLLGMRGAPS